MPSSKARNNVRWDAPELFQVNDGDPVTPAESDIYAFACVCFEVNILNYLLQFES